MKVSREIQREIYTVLMDYFAEELGVAQEKGEGQSSGDSGSCCLDQPTPFMGSDER